MADLNPLNYLIEKLESGVHALRVKQTGSIAERHKRFELLDASKETISAGGDSLIENIDSVYTTFITIGVRADSGHDFELYLVWRIPSDDQVEDNFGSSISRDIYVGDSEGDRQFTTGFLEVHTSQVYIYCKNHDNEEHTYDIYTYGVY